MRSGELHEHAPDVIEPIALCDGFFGVGDAPREPAGDEQEARLVERLARRRDLGDDVAAIAAVGQHLLHTANLTLDPAKASGEIGDRFLGDIDDNLFLIVVPTGVYYTYPIGYPPT